MSVIEVQRLRKTYGATVAVDDVSFSIEEGEIFGILGPNGAGKTTTVECMVGLRLPDAGTIRVLGLDPQTQRAELRAAGGGAAAGERPTGQAEGRAKPSLSTVRSTRVPPTPRRCSRLWASRASGTSTSRSCRAGRSSGCRSRWRSSASPVSPCSTSSRRVSTRRPAGRHGSSSRACANGASPSSWSPTTWTRPSGCATAWPCSMLARSWR